MGVSATVGGLCHTAERHVSQAANVAHRVHVTSAAAVLLICCSSGGVDLFLSEVDLAFTELYVPVLSTSHFCSRGSWPRSVAALRREYEAAKAKASPQPDIPEAAWEIYRDATFSVSEDNNLWIELPGSDEVLPFTVQKPHCSEGASEGVTIMLGHN